MSAAICVAPPARFSITIGWPQIALSRGETAREMLSTEPPAGYGTMMRTGLVGKLCACAASRAQREAGKSQNRSDAGSHVSAPSDRCRQRILDTPDGPSKLRQGRNTVHAAHTKESTMAELQRIFPDGLSKRVVKGHLLYAPVVTVVPGKLVFLSGILSRNSKARSSARATCGRRSARYSQTSPSPSRRPARRGPTS